MTPGESRLLDLLRGSERPLTLAQLVTLSGSTNGSVRVLLHRLGPLVRRPEGAPRGTYEANNTTPKENGS